MDTNDFKRFPIEEAYFRELDTQQLANSIFISFNTNSQAIFNTRVWTIDQNNDLKERLQNLDLKYPIEEQQINNSLFYLACKIGHLDNVKKILEFKHRIDINKTINDGATPFYIACQNGHLDIVKELLKPEYKTDINKATDGGQLLFHRLPTWPLRNR